MRNRNYSTEVLGVRPAPGDRAWICAEAEARGISASKLTRSLLCFAISAYRKDPSLLAEV
jgi:hypothetical protein